MTAPLLDITDLTVAYEQDTVAVDAADMTVNRGELVALVGESGSGKSTLGQTVVGLHHPGDVLDGSIRLEGEELLGNEAFIRAIRGRRVGFAFQDPTTAFDPVYPVGSQLIEAIVAGEDAARDRGFLESICASIRSVSSGKPQARRQQAASLLADVGLKDPQATLEAYPAELSGGQCQRAFLATALAGDPDLLIADEPTAGLDATTRARVLDLLSDLAAERDLGLLVITHDLALVAEHCDRVVVLADGQIVESGPTATVISKPDHPETEALVAAGATMTIDAGHRARGVAEGARVSDSEATWSRGRPSPVVELDCVSKSYPCKRSLRDRLGRSARRTELALSDVSLSVRRGETLGIVGESGGGKSTLIKLLAGLTTPTEGTVRIDGHPVGGLNDRSNAMLADVGVVFQNPHSSLDPRWPIGRSIAEPLVRQGWADDRVRARVGELLEPVGLPETAATARPGQLSGGQVQRGAVARALATHPRVLLLDEPVSALDATTRARVLSVLAGVQASESSPAMVFVSHDLGAVGQVADRIGVIEQGRLVEIGSASDVLDRPTHSATRELIESVPELPAETPPKLTQTP